MPIPQAECEEAIMFSLQAYRGIVLYCQRRGLVAAAVQFIAVSFIFGTAAAQNRDENWTQCRDANPDLSIRGCTALIESGQETTQGLAILFFNRGVGYYHKGEYDRAIQDYDQAIRLKPVDAD